jgi:hypothetical protein
MADFKGCEVSKRHPIKNAGILPSNQALLNTDIQHKSATQQQLIPVLQLAT